MTYHLRYSDYVTAAGPPDPAEWVGPPGPMGPPGPQGIPGPVAEGGQFLPLTGGTVTGPTTFSGDLFSNKFQSDPIMFLGLSGADGPANNWIYCNISLSGALTGGDPAADGVTGVNKVLVTDGAVNSGAAFYAQFVENGNTDPANQGERQALNGRMVVHGQMGQGATAANFVAQASIAYALGSQGGVGGWTPGTDPTGNKFRGALFGGNDNTWLDTGGTNYWLLCGREINTSIFGSGSVYQRIGLLLITKPSTRQAQGDDAGLVLATEDGATPFGHKNAIQFGASTSQLAVTDALIKVVSRLYPTPATPAYVTGLDFTAATFSDNALATPGFTVSGAGNVSTQGVKINGSVVTTSPGGYLGFNSGGSGTMQLTCNHTGGWEGGFRFSSSNNAGTITELFRVSLAGIQFQPFLSVNFATGSPIILPSDLVNAANDAGAASGGVGLRQIYRNGSVLMVRVA